MMPIYFGNHTTYFSGGLKDQLGQRIAAQTSGFEARLRAEDTAKADKEALYAKLQRQEGLDSREIHELERLAADFQTEKRQNRFTETPPILAPFSEHEIAILAKAHQDMVTAYWSK